MTNNNFIRLSGLRESELINLSRIDRIVSDEHIADRGDKPMIYRIVICWSNGISEAVDCKTREKRDEAFELLSQHLNAPNIAI